MSLIARIAGGNEGLFRMKFRSYKALAEWYDMDEKILWDHKYHCEDGGLGQSPSIKEFSDFCKINSIGFSPALIWERKLVPAYFVNPGKLKKLYFMK